MAWRIEFERNAEKELTKLDPRVVQRILLFLHQRIASLENPRSIGEALKGSKLGEFWKYRVGDYRVIAHIEDRTLQILVIRVGNRGDIYRR
jgi:mRNA interferase RelE/StbE